MTLPHVKLIGMLGPGGKADAGLIDLAGLGHFLKHRLHVRDMVHEVEGPPDIHVFGEFPHGQTDDILGIGTVAEEIHAAAQGLEHGVRHLFPQQFQLEEGIDLLAQDIHMDRGAAGDLQGEVACRLPGRRGQQIGVQEDPVFVVRLGHVPGGIGDVIAVGLAQGLEHLAGCSSRW